jgi:predicted acyltransferase
VSVQQASSQKRPDRPPARLLCLDQLRGYAIFGMILVNYLGFFDWAPHWFEHNLKHFSYADTIAPLFIFVVGMGFRLSVKSRAAKAGEADALWHAFKRYVILFCVGVVFYGTHFWIDWWDALVQIALSGLLAIFLINRPAWMRVVFGIACLALFTGLYMGTGYQVWIEDVSMNGGPLSPFAYVFVLLAGTIAYDILESNDSERIFRNAGIWIVVTLVAGLVLLYFLPRGEVYEKYGSLTFTAKRWSLPPFIFISTSCAFAAFAFFYWLNEEKGIELPHLTAFGMNPLVIYLVQYSLLEMRHSYLPDRFTNEGANIIPGLIGCVVFYFVVYAAAWRLYKDKVVIKL